MITENHVSYQHRAPFYTLNRLEEHTDRVWIVFHGYGQLARFFIKKFEVLDPEKNFVIAPQGLSKHYQSGFQGRVGASWMTREDRLTEIDNQLTYLNRVLGSLPDLSGKRLTYFGFSQGVATMFRFAAHAKIAFSDMIVWAGTMPPELDEKDFSFLKGNEMIRYFTGNQDPFYKEGMEQEQKVAIGRVMGISPEIHVFEGEHQVIPDLLIEL